MQLLFTFALVLLMSDAAKMIWGTDQYSVGYPPGLGGAVNLGFVILPQYQLFLCVVGPLIARRHVASGRSHALGPHRARRDPGPRDAGRARRQRADGLRRGVHHRLGAGRRRRRARRTARSRWCRAWTPPSSTSASSSSSSAGWATCGAASSARWPSASSCSSARCLRRNWQDVLPYLLMLAVLLIRPWGLLGRPETGALTMPTAPPPASPRRSSCCLLALLPLAGSRYCRRPRDRGR